MSTKKSPVITIKVSDVGSVWTALTDLIGLNENPFKGQARRLLFKLQPEVKFLQESDPEDIRAVQEKTIDLGERISPPESFPDEYTDVLEKVCTGVPQKQSQISKMLKKKPKKDNS